MKKRIFAICTEAIMMPVKPNMPAIMATTKKIKAQFSMVRVRFLGLKISLQ